jgi:hypothetical protein
VEDLSWFRAMISGVVAIACSRSGSAPSLISLPAFERPYRGDSKLPGLTEELQRNRNGKPPFQLKGLVRFRWLQQLPACTDSTAQLDKWVPLSLQRPQTAMMCCRETCLLAHFYNRAAIPPLPASSLSFCASLCSTLHHHNPAMNPTPPNDASLILVTADNVT